MIDADAQRKKKKKKKTDNARKSKMKRILSSGDNSPLLFSTPSEAACDRETRDSRADCDYLFMGSAPINCPYKID